MAATRSNKSLIEEAEALGDELGAEVSTAGLKNAELVDLVEELKAAKAQADKAPEPSAPPAAPEPTTPAVPAAAAPASAEPSGSGYVVGSGRAVTTRLGAQIGEGTPVTAKMFDGGQKTLDLLIAKGAVVSK